MKYSCKQCLFGAETGLEMARHVRRDHPSDPNAPSAVLPKRPYKKREKVELVAVDPETKLILDAYALFEASETSIEGCLRVSKYLQDRYTSMLEPDEQENNEETEEGETTVE